MPVLINSYNVTLDTLIVQVFFCTRIGVVKKDNEKLTKRLLELKMKRSDLEQKEKEITEPPKRELKKDHRLIPGRLAATCLSEP